MIVKTVKSSFFIILRHFAELLNCLKKKEYEPSAFVILTNQKAFFYTINIVCKKYGLAFVKDVFMTCLLIFYKNSAYKNKNVKMYAIKSEKFLSLPHKHFNIKIKSAIYILY